MDDLDQDARRLEQAGASIQGLLNRVTTETTQVERAIDDLNMAKEQMDMDWGVQLRRGGAPKQAALVGLALFSTRAAFESVALLTTDEMTHGTAALIQGGIAVACAVAFVLL
jgi:hypothetical protein